MTKLEEFYALLGEQAPRPARADLVGFGTMSFERTAACKSGESEKQLFYQGDAAVHVAQKGLVLPRFREIFREVIIPGLEGKLDKEQEAVRQDMFKSFGEWSGDLVLIHQKVLYLAAGTVMWNGNGYDRHQVAASSVTTHNAAKLPRGEYVPLQRVNKADPSIVTKLYGLPFGKLPSEIQQNAYAYFPENDVVRPVGRGVRDYWYDLGGYGDGRASRGAKKNVP